MKKNKYIMLALFLLVLVLGIVFVSNKNNIDDLYNENIPQVVKEEDMLSMMLETAYESGEYKQVTQSSWPSSGYAFNATLSKCENGSELSWDDEQKLVYFAGSSIDKCYVYFDKLPIPLAEWVIEQYNNTQGNNGIYYHNGTITSDDGTVLDAQDSSYRYAGASDKVNNYICLGSSESLCPDANLFRIIGVFNNQVKVIKATSIGTYAWDSNNSNTWSTSSLYNYLNGLDINDGNGYIDEINDFSSKIVTVTWKVGKISSADVTAATMYISEQNSTLSGTDGKTEWPAKIGLMYASDYGFAASPSAWTNILSYNSTNGYNTVTSVNWLYSGSWEWLISPSSKNENSLELSEYGSISQYDGKEAIEATFDVRPTFYLNSDVTYAGGTGTSTDPIRVN